MPAVRSYVVTQEREITVQATSPAEAVQISDAVLGGELNVEYLGHPFSSAVKVTEVRAREEY